MEVVVSAVGAELLLVRFALSILWCSLMVAAVVCIHGDGAGAGVMGGTSLSGRCILVASWPDGDLPWQFWFRFLVFGVLVQCMYV